MFTPILAEMVACQSWLELYNFDRNVYPWNVCHKTPPKILMGGGPVQAIEGGQKIWVDPLH